MKVWIAKWDVRNGGDGVGVYANQDLAVNAVIGYAKEMLLVGADDTHEDAARKRLIENGGLEFDDADCYYWVIEHDLLSSLSQQHTTLPRRPAA